MFSCFLLSSTEKLLRPIPQFIEHILFCELFPCFTGTYSTQITGGQVHQVWY